MYLYELLNVGEENALSQNNLMTALGYSDTREVRAEIERERRAGHIIVSSAAGYFLPANDHDVEMYVRFCLERLRGSFITLKPALEYLDRVKKKGELERMLREKGFEIDGNIIRKIGDQVQQDGKDEENTL